MCTTAAFMAELFYFPPVHLCYMFTLFFQEMLPGLLPYEILYRMYPYNSFLSREGKQSVEGLLATFSLQTVNKNISASIQHVIPNSQDHSAQVMISYNNQQEQFQVRGFINCVM
jgi:hypothetical protein